MELSSAVNVTLIDQMGDESSVVRAARVSTQTEGTVEADEGLLRFLMRNRHASPFEHVTFTFMVDAPIFVAREWMRHRTFSYNEVSGRYSELKPRFYVPSDDRPVKQMGKPGAYEYRPGTDAQRFETSSAMRITSEFSWSYYQHLLGQGIAKEVARMVLPVGIYTQFYATGNLRNWLNFLVLRTAPDAMYEIRQGAARIETLLHTKAPKIVEMWDEYGRHTL